MSHIRVSVEESGSLLRIVLSKPKGNIIDRAMIAEIQAALATHTMSARLATILFEGEGEHFSFGASIQEHERTQVAGLLGDFCNLFRELAVSRKILLAAVRGKCLGGGLELASFCHRVFASSSAEFASPEIALGVFAPIASILLPIRIGQSAADDMLLTGRSVGSDEAARMHLIDEVTQDPSLTAVQWHRTHLVNKSAAALGFAVAASRQSLHDALGEPLQRIERLYLDQLMSTADAHEGIQAFLEKRPPRWQHR